MLADVLQLHNVFTTHKGSKSSWISVRLRTSLFKMFLKCYFRLCRHTIALQAHLELPDVFLGFFENHKAASALISAIVKLQVVMNLHQCISKLFFVALKKLGQLKAYTKTERIKKWAMIWFLERTTWRRQNVCIFIPCLKDILFASWRYLIIP